jgi:MFS transporter, ACS family, tartrate transporter
MSLPTTGGATLGEAAVDVASVEARTIQKVRMRIIPFIFVLYIVAYLDRKNIAFAALTMRQELGINDLQYGLLSGIFFIGYFLLEVPSNLVMHRVGARIWIARILISWGIVAMLGGFVQSVNQVYAVRFLLGVAEAGFAPGMLLYLTYWFREREQAQAVGLYLTGLPIAGILGSPLSALILDHVRWLGVSSWRWLLILEGVPAVALGFLTYLSMPNRPDDATFLTEDEKQWLRGELAREEQSKVARRRYSSLEALTNGRVWLLVAIYFGMLMGLYGVEFYTPQLVKSFASESSNSLIGLLAAIPALVGLGAMILISRRSDRTRERRFHVAIPAVIGGSALALIGAAHSTVAAVALLSVAAIGVYGFLGPFWALPSGFLTGFSAAAGLALINSAGNLGGFVGPYTIGAIAQKTGTLFGGLAVAGGCMIASALLIVLIRQPADVRQTAPQLAGEALT